MTNGDRLLQRLATKGGSIIRNHVPEWVSQIDAEDKIFFEHPMGNVWLCRVDDE